MKTKKLPLASNPITVRLMLVVGSVLVLILTVVLILLSRNFLTGYANKVATITAEAQNTSMTLASLTKAQDSLAEQEEAVKKAKRIVAESKQYQYQNQIVNDLNAYANRANIPISSFLFSNSAGSTAGAGGGESPAAPPAAPAGDKATGQSVAGLKTVQVTIGLPAQVQYKDLLNFLSLIENNATRMQVQGLTISPAGASQSEDGSSQPANENMVTVNSLTIGVYIR